MSNYLIYSIQHTDYTRGVEIYPVGIVIISPCGLPYAFSEEHSVDTDKLNDYFVNLMESDPSALFFTLADIDGVYTPVVLLNSLYDDLVIKFVVERLRVLTYEQIYPLAEIDENKLLRLGNWREAVLETLLKIHRKYFIPDVL